MAMTKTRSVSSMTAYDGGTVSVLYSIVWDDPDDADAPITKTETERFNCHDDTAGKDQIVIDFCEMLKNYYDEPVVPEAADITP